MRVLKASIALMTGHLAGESKNDQFWIITVTSVTCVIYRCHCYSSSAGHEDRSITSQSPVNVATRVLAQVPDDLEGKLRHPGLSPAAKGSSNYVLQVQNTNIGTFVPTTPSFHLTLVLFQIKFVQKLSARLCLTCLIADHVTLDIGNIRQGANAVSYTEYEQSRDTKTQLHHSGQKSQCELNRFTIHLEIQ